MAPLRTRSATRAAVVVAVAALGLAACASPGPTYAALDRAATPADALPDDLPAHALEDVEPDSARLVGEHDGTRLWLLRSAIPELEICLLAFVDAADWMQGCGGGDEVRVSGGPGDFTVLADGAVVPDGLTQVGENVHAAR